MENNWLDLQHRGYAAYLEETEDAQAWQQWLCRIVGAAVSEETIDTAFLDCRVITDWVEQIEQAMPFLEKAVREDRQFILRQGETVPIEKVKRLSRSSVEHLSRHSELITTMPEPGEDLRPEKLHMTENTATYAVYENRFLYMLLRYIREFAGYRHQQIQALSGCFSTRMNLGKEVEDGEGSICFSLQYTQTAREAENSTAAPELLRISLILQNVEALLATGLMREVSKEPILKPPVTRTNVMLHDPNFKAAYGLYTYLSEYQGPGYEQFRLYGSNENLTDMARKDLAALVSLTSYLSHRSGGMYTALQQRYLEQQAQRQAEARLRRQESLERLRQLGAVNEETAGYVLHLEQLLEEAENKQSKTMDYQAQAEALRLQLGAAQEQANALEGRIRELENTVAEALEQRDRCRKDLDREKDRTQTVLEEARQQYEDRLEGQKQEFLEQYQALREKYHLACAMGWDPEKAEDCLSREDFETLEARYKALGRYYDRQWKLAKKHIRKDILWKK